MRGPRRADADVPGLLRVCNREIAAFNLVGKQVAKCLWDFSVDGGATGTFSFGTQLPANAVVTNIWADTITPTTSGGALTYQIAAGATNLTAAESFSGTSPINATAVTEVAMSAEAVKLSSVSELKMTFAGAAATAGKVRFCVEFYVSE